MKPTSTLSTPNATGVPHPSEDGERETVGRPRSGVTAEKDHAIKQAHKVAIKREEINSVPFVWVGNLDPTVTEAQLEKLFSTCGRVHRVCLRRTGAWTAKPHAATQYACVEFRTSTGKVKALKLHGYMMDTKRRLVVCVHPTGLPEFDQTVQSAFDLWDIEKAKKTKAEALRLIHYEPTVPLGNLDPAPSPKIRHNKLFRPTAPLQPPEVEHD
ncbi:hypothetical protein V5O48_004261 [Marasmius crinis-equi]|uniref:RRM domain-containing protein n=1 Tax=Marasmius crinis-equi TaxID=585013 RepID=A0ABR3FQS8_9AGAR